MPAMTGYVSQLITDNLTTEQWALQCARAFGACIMQRDDPMSEEPRDREPSDYYAKAQTEAEEALNQWRCMTDDERDIWAQGEAAKEITRYATLLEEERAHNARLEAVRAQVETWVVPDELAGLKLFMIEQLTTSMQDLAYWEARLDEARRADISRIVSDREPTLQRELDYAMKSHREELDRCQGANRWLALLRESVKSLAPQEASK